MKAQKIRLFFLENWPLWILVILGTIIPINWFSDGRIIGGGDQFPYYNPTNIFSDYFYTWLERINFGEPNMEIQFLFPFLVFFKFFKLLGVSNIIAEIFWAIYLFFFAGVFMYLLVYHLIGKKDIWAKLSALTAGVFYMFNPNTVVDPLPIGPRPIQVAFPLLLLLWIRGLESGKNSLKFALLFGISTLLIASSNSGPAFVSPILIAAFLYTTYFILLNGKLIKAFLFLLQTFIFAIVFNLWWLIPSYFAFQESGQETAEYIRAASDFTRSTKIWEAFRLMGFWAFRIKSSLGMALVPFAHYYYEFPILFISYLFPVIAIFGLIISQKRKQVLIFLILFLVGVFLSKGANSPFGWGFKYFYDSISFFSIFRNPYSKFTLLTLFSLSVLLGLSWNSILNWVSSRFRLLATLVLLGLNLIFAFPIVTGKAFQDPSWHKTTLDSLHVEIPQYWFDAGLWFEKNDPQARVIQFPKSGYGNCYNWVMGTCSGEPMGRMFLPNQVVKYPGAEIYYRDSILNSFYKSIFDGELKDFVPALGFLGVKYVLQQNDLAWNKDSKDAYTPEKMAALLKSQKKLDLVKSVGKLDIYSIGDKYVYPWVYAVNDLVIINSKTNQAGKLINFKNIRFPQTFLVSDKKELGNYSNINIGEMKVPQKISFRRINPTRFEVDISESKGPYYLILLSSFSESWKTYIFSEKEKLPFLIFNREPLSESSHFVANGFGNGWMITPDDSQQNASYKLVIEYYPQKYFYLALFVSGICIILSLGCIVFRKLKE